MAIYDVRMPNGEILEIRAPDDATESELLAIADQYYASRPAPKEEKSSALRQAADIPVGIAKGAVQGIRFIADAFGADNEVSKTLRGAEDYLGRLMSAQSQKDAQEISRIMSEAEDKGVLDQVLAGIKALSVAPVDLISQALGTAAPALIGGLAGMGLRTAAVISGGMGAGVTKSSIYEATRDELVKAGLSKEEAEARAQLAQAYDGQNLDQILLGTGLGALSGFTGIERAILPNVVRNITQRAAAKSAVARAGQVALGEAVPEALQAGQEQVAANIALQREGFDVDTFRGAAGAATLEGLVGGLLGGGVGALSRAPTPPSPTPPPAPPEGTGQAPAIEPAYIPAPAPLAPPAIPLEEQLAQTRLQSQQAAVGAVSPLVPPTEEAAKAQRIQRQQAAAEQFGLAPPVAPEFAPFSALPEISPAQTVTRPAAPTVPAARQQQAMEIDRLSRGLEASQSPEEAQFYQQKINEVMGVQQPVAQPRFVELTPMDRRTAAGRRDVLRNELANQGQSSLGIEIVPHPSVPNAFALEQRPVDIDLGLSPADVAPEVREAARQEQRQQEQQQQEAALQAQIEADQAPAEAPMTSAILEAMRQPAPTRTADQNALINLARQRLDPADFAAIETQAQSGALMSATDRIRLNALLRAETAPAPVVAPEPAPAVPMAVPDLDITSRALKIAPAMRSADQVAAVNIARQRLSPEEFGALQVEAQSPALLTAEGKIRLDALRKGERYSLTDEVSPEVQGLAAEVRQKLLPVLQRFGLGNVGLRLVETLNDGRANGVYWKQVITLALDSNDPLAVMRHEVIHALKELGAFTDAEWKALTKRARAEWIDKYLGPQMVDRYREQYAADNNGNMDGFQEYIEEEAIAEAFKDFKQTKPPAGMIANLMRRLGEMFRAIGDFFRSRNLTPEDIFLSEQIFADIEGGRMTPGRAPQRGVAAPVFSLTDADRSYKLDIEREARQTAKVARLSKEETASLEKDAKELGLSNERINEIIAQVKVDKKRFPTAAGWEPLTVVGIDTKKDENKQPIPGTESPKYQAIGYGYAVPPGKDRTPSKIDEAWLAKVQKEFASFIEDIYKRADAGDKNAKNIIAHQNWYRSVAQTLRREYGAFGDLLSDLLGATSPNTPVDTNWVFSVDVFRRFVRGDFDNEMKAFTQHLESGKPMKDFPGESKIRQISGKLYGMNSGNAMLALADVWRAIKPGQAPKARNFALNLIGQSNIATIDVWAARMLRRAADAANKGKFKRIPPPAEMGVSGTWSADGKRITGEFGFGAEVMRRVSEDLAAKGIDVSPPDLQAIAWFAEKELWGSKGWTSKTGEGGSFEENIEKFPVERFVVGHSVQQGEVRPDVETVVQAKQAVESALKNDPGIVAYRVKETKGLYGGTIEEAFDTEFVAEKGRFDPTDLVSVIAQTSQNENQYDFFISRVVDPREDNPNARPGVELYFKSKMALDNVMPILSEFTSRGVDGFTLALDPRVDDSSGQYIGVRLQFVPEISMRWDEGMRSVMESPEGLTNLMQAKRNQINDVVARISQIEDIAYAASVKYDTVVVGKENYDDYTDPRIARRNIETGKAVWFGQPIRNHVEAAIGRYTGQRPAEGVRGVVDTGKDGAPRYSLRPDQIAFRPSDRGREGISFQPTQPDAKSYIGSHYGNASVDRLEKSKYGTGLKGAERARLDQSSDPRIRNRVYFYIPRFNDTMPPKEAGVGNFVYSQKFNNILGPGPTMARLYRDSNGDSNAFESAVIDAGYDGYAVPDYGMMVILNQDVPVDFEGTVQDLVQAAPKFSLRPDAKKVVATPPFKRWFGNSKVTNPDGTPKVMYHGTAQDITEFRPKRAAAIFTTDNPNFAEDFTASSESYMIDELYNSLSAVEEQALRAEASKIAKKNKTDGEDEFRALLRDKLPSRANIMPVYVRAENPFDYDNPDHIATIAEALPGMDLGFVQNGSWQSIESPEVQQAIRDAGFDGFYVKEGGQKNLAVYNPNQIKSATGNIGTFDESGNIRYSLVKDTPNAPPQILTKTTPQMTRGKAIQEATKETLDNFRDDDYWTQKRIIWVDKDSGLTQELKSLPLYDPNGTLRADMLKHAQAQVLNLIKMGLGSGTPFLNRDGTISIERSENNLARSEILAEQLSTHPDVIASGRTGKDFVADVARALRGADIMAEDAEIRKGAEEKARQSRELMAQAREMARGKRNTTLIREAVAMSRRLAAEARADRKINRELQVTPESIAWAKKQLQNIPQLQEIFDIWKAVNTSLVNLQEEVGILSPEQAQTYRDKKFYVPLFKSQEDLDTDMFGLTVKRPSLGVGAKTAPGKQKRLKGSLAERNIWENLETQYARMLATSYENQTRRVAFKQLAELGGARLANPAEEPNLRFRQDGKDVGVIVENPNVMAAFQTFSYEMSPIMRFMGGVTNVLRAGALINPMFWLRQLIRDPLHATLVANSGVVTPFHAAGNFVKALTDSSPEARILAERGVVGPMDQTVDLQDFLRGAGRAGSRNPGMVQKAIHKLLQIHEASDVATRVSVFKNAKEKALKDGMSEEQAVDYAVFKARESINFSVKGMSPFLSSARQMIPFLNATIVGLDTLYRAAKGYGMNPEEKAEAQRQFRIMGGTMFVAAIVYAAMYQNDDDYKNLPDYVKDNNFLIPIGTGEGKTFIKLAIPYEVGFIFKTLPEVAIRYLAGNSTGKEMLASYLGGLLHNLPTGGVPIPQAFRPAAEVVSNFSFFTMRPIEGMGDQGLPTAFRGDKASAFAKVLSGLGLDKIGLSPTYIDYLMQGYFAEAGTFSTELASGLLNVAQGKEAPSYNIEQMPFFRSFMTNPASSKAVADFYEISNTAQETANAFNRLTQRGMVDEAQEYISNPERQMLIGSASAMRKIRDGMAQIRKQMGVIREAPGMSADEKRDMLNELQKVFNQLAQQGSTLAEQLSLR